MARKWMLVVVGAVLALSLVGCGPSEKHWKDSEALARKFLTDFSNQKFAENFQMWDPLSQWKLDGHKEEGYVNLMTKAAATLPEMFNWAYDIERFEAAEPNGIYKFKVKLRYRTGDPIEVAKKYDQPIPNIYPEMLLIMQRHPDGWKVLTLQKFEIIDPYSRESGSSSRGPQMPGTMSDTPAPAEAGPGK